MHQSLLSDSKRPDPEKEILFMGRREKAVTEGEEGPNQAIMLQIADNMT